MADRLTWYQMQEKYPDQWVILTDVDLDGSTIISGVVVEVCNDDEVDAHFCKLIKSGKKYMKERTTDMGGIGVIYGANYSYEVR